MEQLYMNVITRELKNTLTNNSFNSTIHAFNSSLNVFWVHSDVAMEFSWTKNFLNTNLYHTPHQCSRFFNESAFLFGFSFLLRTQTHCGQNPFSLRLSNNSSHPNRPFRQWTPHLTQQATQRASQNTHQIRFTQPRRPPRCRKFSPAFKVKGLGSAVVSFLSALPIAISSAPIATPPWIPRTDSATLRHPRDRVKKNYSPIPSLLRHYLKRFARF